MAHVKDEYIIERQGRRMALYAGLLDAFHVMGHEGQPFEGHSRVVETKLIQTPTTQNEHIAIVQATVGYKDDGEWTYGPFMGIGDASPENVNRNIIPHIIRQAETRAKARAFRDAINVGDAISDDIPEDGAPEATAPKGYGGHHVPRGGKERPRPPAQESYEGTESGATATRGGAALKPDDPAPKHLKDRLRELIDNDLDWAGVSEWEDAHMPIEDLTVSEISKSLRQIQRNQ